MKQWTPVILAVALTGCASAFQRYSPRYDVGLTEVERPASAKARYGESVITKVADSASISRYQFEDQLVKITAFTTNDRIYFDLANKTDHSIKINWTEAAFVGLDGKSGPVMHTGMKYTDCESAKAPSIVVKKGAITDEAIPCSNVHFMSGAYGGWDIGSFIPTSYVMESDTSIAASSAKQQIGKKVQLLLPIQIEEITNDYLFTFEVKGARIANTRAP